MPLQLDLFNFGYPGYISANHDATNQIAMEISVCFGNFRKTRYFVIQKASMIETCFGRYALIKGLLLLLLLLFLIGDNDLILHHLDFILIGEIVVSAIALMALTRDEKPAVQLPQIIAGSFAIVMAGMIRYSLAGYNNYTLQYEMMRYWTGIQPVYIILLILSQLKKAGIRRYLAAGIIVFSILIAMVTVLNSGISGNNAHLTRPITGMAVNYLLCFLMLSDGITTRKAE